MNGTVENQLKETSLRDLYYVFFRHKKKVIIFFFVVIITVTLGTFLAPEIYQSEAKLLVRLGRESVTLDPTATTGQVISIAQSREEEINSEIEILKSRELAEEIVDRIGVEAVLKKPDEIILYDTSTTGLARDAVRKTRQRFRDLASQPGLLLAQIDITDTLKKHDKATLHLMRNLKIDVQKRSNIISISYEAQSQKLANSVVSELIDSFLEKHIEVHYAKGSYNFFTDQTDKLLTELTETEESLVDLKNETGIASLDEQRTIILTRLGDLKREIDQNNTALAATRAKIQALERITSDLSEMFENERIVGNDYMHADLYRLQLEEQDLLVKYSEENIKVKDIRRQLAEAKRIMNSKSQIIEGINTTNQQLQLDLFTERSNLESFQSRAIELNNLQANAKAELNQLNDNEAKIIQLERERDIRETNYRKYSDNLEQARIDEALQNQKLSNISIIQSATFPMKPIRPRKLLNIALGLFLAFFGSIGLAFFSEYLDHSIMTQEDIKERLQLRTLVTIPENKLVTIPEEYEKYDITFQENIHKYYEILCNTFQQKDSSQLSRSVCLTSCYRGQGVSTIASNLAKTLAHHNKRVLLVDANYHNPLIHKIFRLNLSPGLREFIYNSHSAKDVIQTTPIKNLFILTAGESERDPSYYYSKVPNSGKEIIKDEMKTAKIVKVVEIETPAIIHIVKKLKKYFHFVIFDTPAISESNSVSRMAGIFDDVILVIEAERVRWEAAQNVKEQLDKANANILGVVLNRKKFHVPRWLYKTL